MLNELAVRFLGWVWRELVRRVGLFGLFSIVMLQLTLYFAVLGLKEVVGGLEMFLGRLFWLLFSAVLLGRWAGVRKRWWGWLLGVAVLAIPFVFIWMGDLGDELRQVIRAVLMLGRAFTAHILADLPVSEFIPPDSLQLTWFNFSLEAWTYLDDLRNWFNNLQAGRPAFQARAVAFVWGEILFATALWAAAFQRRSGRILPALLPAGAVLLMTFAFARVSNLAMLFLFMSGMLTLIAAETQRENEHRWRVTQLDHPDDMRLDFSLSSSVLISGILVAAIVVPYFNVRTFLRGIVGIDRPAVVDSAGDDGLLGESLGIARPTPLPPFFNSYAATGMPRSHLLGMPPELQHELVLKIQLTGPGELAGNRYYWRSLAYDVYLGNGWEASRTDTVRYARGAEIPLEDLPYGLTIRQTVEVVNRPTEIASAAGDIFSVDRPFEAAWYVPIAGVFDAFGVRVRDRTYVADSQYPILHAPTLRKAGTDYPEWVLHRYLALPDSVPQRVRDLAVDLTAGAATPYDKAAALETYLRRFPYSLSVPLPPADRDIVEYFLFDLQRGYCDYYATSMVVLARSVGLPTRLAVGYAEGRYDPDDRTYFVTGMDAHSWPEIYFPGFGWVPFEPTAGLVDIVPLGEYLPSEIGQPDLPPLVSPSGEFAGQLRRVVEIALIWTAFLGIGWLLLDRVRFLRQSPEAFFREVVQQLYRRGSSLGVPLPARATPTELTDALSAHLTPRFRHFNWITRFPGAPTDLSVLCEPYLRIEYSQHQLTEKDKSFGLRIWRSLRWKLVFISLAEGAFTRAQLRNR